MKTPCFRSRKAGLTSGWAGLGLGLLLVGGTCRGGTPVSLAERAEAYHRQLTRLVMPYWYDTTIDRERGGYLLADDGRGNRGGARDKQLVSQARMVWGFSLAHRMGWSDATRDYLRAARHGVRFLLERFRDPDQGGYYWKTDLEGRPINDRKKLYGQSFVIYALVEYFRAGGEQEALRHALELFAAIQQRTHDRTHGGWGEHYTRDWQLVREQDNQIEVELAGKKSANAHLHWMEALTELYDATREPAVREALEEALRLNATWFYPHEPGRSAYHRNFDWSRVTGGRSDGLSYGHNVEFAWLMIRAEQILGRTPSWPHFEAHLDHALEYGFDHARGGLFNTGHANEPATDRDKVWWSQSELLAALTDALLHRENDAWRSALEKLVTWLDRHQIDPVDGIWFDTLAEDGARKRPAKAHNWKANYHDVRALVKFIEAFRP